MIMKLVWELKGQYERVINEGDKDPSTSLKVLMGNIQAIATHHHCHQVKRVHSSFGLHFLSPATFIYLMDQASGLSPLIPEHLIQPTLKTTDSVEEQSIEYRFITTGLAQNFSIRLAIDDPHLPRNFSERCEGYYPLTLSRQSHPILKNTKQNVIEKLKKYVQTRPLELLNHALNSPGSHQFAVSLDEQFTAWISSKDLPSYLQVALKTLQGNCLPEALTSDPVVLNQAQRIVEDYRKLYPTLPYPSDKMPEFRLEQTTNPSPQLIIGKSIHRQHLQRLVDNAQKFLFLCSYRIEDLEIIEAIARKARDIPVFILTDFSEKVQDKVDVNMDAQRRDDPDYINSDKKKKECLRLLFQSRIASQSPVYFRGGDFHLKTYISEQSAYLGSCNLTGGSLGRNGEAGIVWSGTQEHNFLLHYFQYLWMCKTTVKAQPSPTGMSLETLTKTNMSPPQQDSFLHTWSYKQDLTKALQNFAQSPQGKIRIYTRNFNPTPQLLNLLKVLNCQIFYSNFNNTPLKAKKIQHLHAKIVLIGNQVAYIGSNDYAFNSAPSLDLMYKTEVPEEIQAIAQQVQHLH